MNPDESRKEDTENAISDDLKTLNFQNILAPTMVAPHANCLPLQTSSFSTLVTNSSLPTGKIFNLPGHALQEYESKHPSNDSAKATEQQAQQNLVLIPLPLKKESSAAPAFVFGEGNQNILIPEKNRFTVCATSSVTIVCLVNIKAQMTREIATLFFASQYNILAIIYIFIWSYSRIKKYVVLQYNLQLYIVL